MGPLMLDVSGYELTHEEIDILDHPLVGGVILFNHNYYDHNQLSDVIRHIRMVTRNGVLIATNHESGRVQSFNEGFSKIPIMGSIALGAKEISHRASDLCEQFGWLMAAELLAFDIDISFAPVLDIQDVSSEIGSGSFHQQPEKIIHFASAFIKGMHRAGMSATGKHFPGQGNMLEDPQNSIPVDNRPKEELFALDMAVFKGIHQSGLLDAVMPAQVIYPDVDDLPAGFSQKWIKQILRQDLDFEGVVFSDDLSKQRLVSMGNIVDRATLAIEAGCDMVLVCNDAKGAVSVIDGLPADIDLAQSSVDRIKGLRKTTGLDFTRLKKTADYQAASRVLDQFYANQ